MERTEDVASRLIQEYEVRVKQEPNNRKLLRSIAELHIERKEYEQGLAYFERIKGSEGGNDPSLDKVIAETVLKRFDHQIAQLDANDPDQAAQIATLQAERVSYQVAECQQRVERYPTDLQIRFEMGQLYLQVGKLSEAIQEFQKSQANPHLRIQSLNLLGQCFARKGMLDLAARTLQNALREKLVFDDEKKDLVYSLGCVLEQAGRADEAVKQFEQIYEVDITYRDVGARVDAYYASKSKASAPSS